MNFLSTCVVTLLIGTILCAAAIPKDESKVTEKRGIHGFGYGGYPPFPVYHGGYGYGHGFGHGYGHGHGYGYGYGFPHGHHYHGPSYYYGHGYGGFPNGGYHH